MKLTEKNFRLVSDFVKYVYAEKDAITAENAAYANDTGVIWDMLDRHMCECLDNRLYRSAVCAYIWESGTENAQDCIAYLEKFLEIEAPEWFEDECYFSRILYALKQMEYGEYIDWKKVRYDAWKEKFYVED